MQVVQKKIIYRSRVMHDLVSKAIAFAKSSATVLITGENGTGKELFARLIHEASDRAELKYCQVNCAAFAQSLVESEFFGHERGAFTGADQPRIGQIEWTKGGTLLLDEVSEMDVGIQAKLLRVLEERNFRRVGSNESISSEARFLATSNRDLRKHIQEGKFREDLYYRLNVLRLNVPPLRERTEDIPVLANLFLQGFRVESQAQVTGIAPRAMNILCDYQWPGNVRQLRNAIMAACVVADSKLIDESHLPDLDDAAICNDLPDWLLRSSMEEIERRVIIACLTRANGNKTIVAKILGVTTRTLNNKVRQYRESGVLSLAAF